MTADGAAGDESVAVSPRGSVATVRRAAQVGVFAVVTFWVLVVVAGRLQPGYRPARDYVSALASEGARWPVLGIVALLAFGVGYLAAAAVVDLWLGARAAAVLVTAAGLVTWVVALARIHCPEGAAGCSQPSDVGAMTASTGSSLGPHVHGVGVAVSYACAAVAMLLLTIRAARRRERRRALVSGVALVTSLLSIHLWYEADSPGGGQRLWLAILSAWILLLCAEPLLATAYGAGMHERAGDDEERS